MSWKLPGSPNSRAYHRVLAEIDDLHRTKRHKEASQLFRAIAEEDFWFYLRFVSLVGKLKIGQIDPDNRFRDRFLPEHPEIFALARAAQDVMVNRRHLWLFYLHRMFFKTTILTQEGSLWLGCRDRAETILIVAPKIEQTGENFGAGIRTALKNPVLTDHWWWFRELEEDTDTRMTWARPPGPREPSISIIPAVGEGTSAHPTWIWCDDLVTKAIVSSEALAASVERTIEALIPLRTGRTPMVFVGTPWGLEDSDPVYRRYLNGWFRGHYTRPDRNAETGRPYLYSDRFLDEQAETMTDPMYSSQYKLKPIPLGGTYFDSGMKRYYHRPIEDVAAECRIHMVIDQAASRDAKNQDFIAIRVCGIHRDGHRYNLDLWRERIGLADFLDLLFGVPPEYHADAEHAWKPRDGIVRRWREFDPFLMAWIENYQTAVWYQAILREMKLRRYHFQLETLPSLKRSKEDRIMMLQPPYRSGKVLYPIDGFGHGSRGDERDTMQQYWKDEFLRWGPEEKIPHDDALDTDAWFEQPELQHRFRPKRAGADGVVLAEDYDPFNPEARRAAMKRRRSTSFMEY